jgi:hypothetical protein
MTNPNFYNPQLFPPYYTKEKIVLIRFKIILLIIPIIIMKIFINSIAKIKFWTKKQLTVEDFLILKIKTFHPINYR